MLKLPPPEEDGLYTPEVGEWSAHKHHFLRRYVDGFTTAMKSKGWKGLNYIDLFAGAGIERIEGNGLDWGSPLIAAQARYHFTRLYLCELKKRRFSALKRRVGQFAQPTPPFIEQGDANAIVDQIVGQIPTGSLSLAFLDPHGLHLHFTTLQKLATKRTDFIIFFPDHLDALRNWKIYQGKPNSNLDLVLGTQAWREPLNSAPQDKRADALNKVYEGQIRRLGYTEFEHERISLASGRFLYKLLFCSRDKAGGEIWRGIAQRKADGQGTFDFGGR
jgi:three-Cys-motif partner protein